MKTLVQHESAVLLLFFLIDWHHKRLENTIDLLLFYGEHFYGFLEKDLWKCQEKNIQFTTNISIYKGHRHSEVLWSFTLYILQRLVLSLKIVIMLIFLSICIKYPQHQEMRKNNSKLNFMKNGWVSWFSCGQLKISKCSISFAWLGECSKSKATPLHPVVLSKVTHSGRGITWNYIR